MIRFLHISDTHFGPGRDFIQQGKNTYEYAQKLLSFIRKLPSPVDFIVHTGDLVTTQDAACYAVAREAFSSLTIPLYYVVGNHDDPAMLASFQPFAARNSLQGGQGLSYSFTIQGLLAVVIDVKNPDNAVPNGVLTDSQLQAIKEVLSASSEPFVLFTHFPLLAFDAPWMDTHLCIDRGAALHGLLQQFRDRCRGVFLGHIHQALTVSQDGISYHASPSSAFLFGGWPTDIKAPSYNLEGLPGCNLVSIDGGKTVVKFLHYQ